MSAAHATPTTELPNVHEHVRLECFVAEGGFGRVYRGHHLTLDRPVAIKVLKVPEEYSEGMRAIFFERFAQEARIIASLDHPAVVRALDFGVATDAEGREAPYMILDWIDGRTLNRAIGERRDAGRPYDRDETLLLLSPILEALAQAHARGIAHRDITPGNLMVVDGPSGPSLRLLDFGIAKVVDDTRPEASASHDASHTHTALLAFSPRWAAPEQAARGRTGPWTDVHALALVCTAMLTGERPYKGANESLFQEIFSERRPTPASLGRDVGSWEPVLARALSLRSESRQPDAAVLLRELQDAMAPSSPTRVMMMPAHLRAPASPVTSQRSPWFYAAVGATLTLVALALTLTLAATRRTLPPRPTPPPQIEATSVAAPPSPAPSVTARPAAPPARVEPPVATPPIARQHRAPSSHRRAESPREALPTPAPDHASEPTPLTERPPATSGRRRIDPVREYR